MGAALMKVMYRAREKKDSALIQALEAGFQRVLQLAKEGHIRTEVAAAWFGNFQQDAPTPPARSRNG
eukprot:12778744-Alexandrium_andersonii.AAC.1